VREIAGRPENDDDAWFSGMVHGCAHGRHRTESALALGSVNELHRIIDANANRAREALRVMEDVARFGLDDAPLTEAIKQLRHDLRQALEQPSLDRALLLDARDVEHDEGRSIKTKAELSRAGLRDIAAAACARLTEALRSIEEAAKSTGADSSPIEAIRYSAYSLEKALLLALPTGACPQWRLCVLVTESLCRGRPWLGVARAALEGGADCLQLREKELSDSELLDRACRLVALGREFGRDVVINDRPDIAILAEARGVHVGQDDLPGAEVRRVTGFRLLIGVSTSNLTQARAAARSGADYCGIGPMFATTTKHKPDLAGPQYVREYLADPLTSQRPHLAIGGITPQNAGSLRDAGCRGIAVSSAVCGADDPAATCQSLLTSFADSAAMARP
jgi:thiamine-phosphate pyrophosphorylase